MAVLMDVCWLDICGRIDCRELSPKTAYKAYLIFNLDPESYGLKFYPQRASVRLAAQISEGEVYLRANEDLDLQEGLDTPPGVRVPQMRSDGWLEIELGEFFNEDGGDGEVSMSFREVEVLNWKRGLIVEGIQVRPK